VAGHRARSRPITRAMRSDFIRTAIMSLHHFAEQTDDDVELAKVHKCIVGLHSILADHASTKDKALSMTPALQHVRRSRKGY
jgi:hypothetical protein